jgi:PTS system trehalose-specific IIC component
MRRHIDDVAARHVPATDGAPGIGPRDQGAPASPPFGIRAAVLSLIPHTWGLEDVVGQYTEGAKAIIEAVGGQDNIAAVTNCVARLRLVLLDDSKVDKTRIAANDLAQGSFMAAGQFQIVIGPGTVEEVAAEIRELTGKEELSQADAAAASAEYLNPLRRGIQVLGDIFIPLLPAIVTAGLLIGVNNVLTATGLFWDDESVATMYPWVADWAGVINLIASTSFIFMPVLIGWSAVKRFGGNPLFGIVLGAMLVHPDLLNAWTWGSAHEAGEIPTWTLFGMEVQKVGYQGQVLPLLVASWVLVKIELWLKARTPDMIQLLVVGPVTLLVTGLLSFGVIGPVTFQIGAWLAEGLVWIFEHAPWLGGFVYGFFYAPLVITGMHHTFVAVDLQLIGSTGTTFLWPMLAISNICQGSACLGMMFVVANQKEKGLAMASGISAYLGITEPALFGVNLRFKFPFFIACSTSGLCGMWLAVTEVKASGIGVGGIPGIFSIVPQYRGAFGFAMLVAIGVPTLVTFLYAKTRGLEETPDQASALDEGALV